jgi:hypothetical protein
MGKNEETKLPGVNILKPVTVKYGGNVNKSINIAVYKKVLVFW